MSTEVITLQRMIYLINRWTICLLPVLAGLLFWKLKTEMPNVYLALVKEDQWLEQLQFICYTIAAILAFRVALLFRQSQYRIHALLYLGLCVTLLFVAFEEVSWGQRMFGWGNPDYFAQNNVQRELNLHNLNAITIHQLHRAYILLGLFGSLGWLAISTLKLSPLNVLRFVVPPWFLSSYFVPVLLVYGLFEYLTATTYPWHREALLKILIWRDQEPAETLLAIGFALFCYHNLSQLRRVF